jgi:hypothetical protein
LDLSELNITGFTAEVKDKDHKHLLLEIGTAILESSDRKRSGRRSFHFSGSDSDPDGSYITAGI